MDYTNIIRYVRMADPYSNQTMVYFPGTNTVLWPLGLLDDTTGIVLMLGLLLAVTALLCSVGTRSIRPNPARILVITVFLVSYPILFTIDRANFEILIFVSVAGFALAMTKHKRGWAAAALSFAIAMKLTPLLFAGVLLRRGDRRYFLLSGALAGLQILIGILIPRVSALDSVSWVPSQSVVL